MLCVFASETIPSLGTLCAICLEGVGVKTGWNSVFICGVPVIDSLSLIQRCRLDQLQLVDRHITIVLLVRSLIDVANSTSIGRTRTT